MSSSYGVYAIYPPVCIDAKQIVKISALIENAITPQVIWLNWQLDIHLLNIYGVTSVVSKEAKKSEKLVLTTNFLPNLRRVKNISLVLLSWDNDDFAKLQNPTTANDNAEGVCS